MENIELKNKLEELFENQEFCAKMAACDSISEMAQVISEAGIEVDGKELEEELAAVYAGQRDCELYEDQLEDVSGGCIISGTAFLVGCMMISAAMLIWSVYTLKTRRR